MRLIDADQFRRYIHEQLEIDDFCVPDEILEMIDEQETINEWIPCSERLPENHGYYVVTAEMDNERYIRMAVYDRYGFGVRMFETIVAWMNIEEYKGDNHESITKRICRLFNKINTK